MNVQEALRETANILLVASLTVAFGAALRLMFNDSDDTKDKLFGFFVWSAAVLLVVSIGVRIASVWAGVE